MALDKRTALWNHYNSLYLNRFFLTAAYTTALHILNNKWKNTSFIFSNKKTQIIQC